MTGQEEEGQVRVEEVGVVVAVILQDEVACWLGLWLVPGRSLINGRRGSSGGGKCDE